MGQAAELRKKRTRERIVETARKLFGQVGYHETQVMDIVKAVGMSAGTFYNHFRDKQDLFDQLTVENIENLRAQLRRLREPFIVNDEEEQHAMLRDSFTAFFDHVDDNPDQVMMLLKGREGREASMGPWDAALAFGHDLRADVERWLEQGLIAVHDPVFFSHAVVGMALQITYSYLVEKSFEREEAIDALLAMTLANFDACFRVPDSMPGTTAEVTP